MKLSRVLVLNRARIQASSKEVFFEFDP